MAKKPKYVWNNFREGLSDDKYVAKPSTFQVSSNIDTRTNPIGAQLSPKLLGVREYTAPVVGIMNLGDFGSTGMLTYHTDGKVYVDGVLKMDIATHTADTNLKIFNAFYRYAVLAGEYLYFIGHRYIHRAKLDFSYIEYDKYDMLANTDLISRPALIQGDTALIGVGNQLYKITVDNLSNDIFKPVSTFDLNLKINDITFGGQYYNIFVSEGGVGSGNQGNGYIYKMDLKTPQPNFTIYMNQNPVRKAINDGIVDYVITGYSDEYSDLWKVSGFDTILIKRGPERSDTSRFKFSTKHQASLNRKGILYIAGKHNGDEGIFTFGSYYPKYTQIFTDSFVFDTVVIPSGNSGEITAIHATANMLYVGYTLNGHNMLGVTELQYTPVNGYKQTGKIRSNRFNAGQMFPRKSIEEINVNFDLDDGHRGSIEVKYSIDGGEFKSLGTIATDAEGNINNRYKRFYARSMDTTFFNEIEFEVLLTAYNDGAETPVFHGLEMIYGFEQFD